jgi:hypothetical protein
MLPRPIILKTLFGFCAGYAFHLNADLMVRKTHPTFLGLGSPGGIGKGSNRLGLFHPGGLEIVKEDIRVDIGAIVPGNGPTLNSHGLEHFRIAADRLKDGSVQERLQIDFPLRVIVKGNQHPEAL